MGYFRRALLAQHEARRAEFMNNFGNFQTSQALGRKALQKIQHYELRLKKERMHGWVRIIFLFLINCVFRSNETYLYVIRTVITTTSGSMFVQKTCTEGTSVQKHPEY